MRIVMALAIVVPVVALVLIAEEGEEGSGPLLVVDSENVVVGHKITGFAEGLAPLKVELWVDEDRVELDDESTGGFGGKELNNFEFPTDPTMVGKTVKVIVTDGSGRTAEKTIHVTHQEE